MILLLSTISHGEKHYLRRPETLFTKLSFLYSFDIKKGALGVLRKSSTVCR